MKIVKCNLFPISLLEVSEFLTESQCTDIISYLRTLPKKSYPAMTGESFTTFNISNRLLEDVQRNVKSCNNILSALSDIVLEYEKTSGYDCGKLSNSWASFQHKHSALLTHTHYSSLISGVIYLQVDSNSSKIFFNNVNPFLTYLPKKHLTNHTYDKMSFDPAVGKLIIFPSWLPHGSDTELNQSDERIIISFNTELTI
jgi:uncharacterized protein (TIGR02466 family)